MPRWICKISKHDLRAFLLAINIFFMTGLIGLLAAWAARDIGLPSITPAIAFIIGYVGGDFIENIFKILTKKDSFFTFSS